MSSENKTIDERARQSFQQECCKELENSGTYCNGYIAGATEQCDIDTQRACEWYCNKCKWAKSCAMRSSKDTCSKIKELKQAIKGE